MIKNKQYRINKSEIEITPNTSLIDVIKKVVGKDAIRWYISQITSDEMIIQATLYSKQFAEMDESVEGQYYPGKTVVVNIIPTGIGCSIGGYAGDATPTANAIAITTNVQDLPSETYAKHFRGECPNPVGGVEAIMSHLMMKKFQIPVAHAPLLNIKDLDLVNNIVDARGAGEMASTSGLACILVGLQKAPQIKQSKNRIADIIYINNVLAVVIPTTCLGGVPILQAEKYNIPVIAVGENHTILDVSQSKLQLNNVIEAHSYAEAAGLILALKNNIHLESLSRPLMTLRP
ncbi:MAG: DUF3326 domain-containing protein [Trichodesmium sp. MAG_R02]|nr:DUF3326 domain-containing protein [Trichodesmium sp. MAG_R02]